MTDLAGLIERLEGVRTDLAPSNQEPFEDPKFGPVIRALGAVIGYGAMMTSASAAWRAAASERGWPVGGEFTVGPCRIVVARMISELDDVIATLRALQASTGEGNKE